MMLNTIKNSWHYIKPMKECQQLFQEELSEYSAHFFHCECGHQELIVLPKYQVPNYNCPSCNNKDFLYGFNAMERENIISEEKHHIKYRCEQTSDGFKATAYVQVPSDADYIRRSIIFVNKELFHLTLRYDGTKLQDTSPSSLQVSTQIEDILRTEVVKTFQASFSHLNRKRPWIIKRQDLNEMVFYIFNPHHQNSCLFYWSKYDELRSIANTQQQLEIEHLLLYLIDHRKERSIRRAMFERYEIWREKCMRVEHLDKHKRIMYNPALPFVASRCFDDPNVVVEILKNDQNLQYIFFPDDGYALRDVIWLFKFLKMLYSKRQLTKFLYESADYRGTWRDTLRLVSSLKLAIKKDFNKVKLSPYNLHQEIIRISQVQREKSMGPIWFSYTSNDTHACGNHDDLIFKLPKSSKDLNEWGSLLYNCLAGYVEIIKACRTTVFGVFKEDQLCYAVEVDEGGILQMSGKYNKEISGSDRLTIVRWNEKYRQNYLIDYEDK